MNTCSTCSSLTFNTNTSYLTSHASNKSLLSSDSNSYHGFYDCNGQINVYRTSDSHSYDTYNPQQYKSMMDMSNMSNLSMNDEFWLFLCQKLSSLSNSMNEDYHHRLWDAPEYIPSPSPSTSASNGHSMQSRHSSSMSIESSNHMNQLYDAPEYAPNAMKTIQTFPKTENDDGKTLMAEGVIVNIDCDYSCIVKYVLWNVIHYQSCSVQELMKYTKMSLNVINAVLYNLYLWKLLETTYKGKQIEYKLSSRILAKTIMDKTNNDSLITVLEHEFGKFNFESKHNENKKETESETHSIANSEWIENDNILILKNVINHQTCSINKLMVYTNLDECAVKKALEYWKSMGFALEKHAKHVQQNKDCNMETKKESDDEHKRADQLIKQEKIKKILSFTGVVSNHSNQSRLNATTKSQKSMLVKHNKNGANKKRTKVKDRNLTISPYHHIEIKSNHNDKDKHHDENEKRRTLYVKNIPKCTSDHELERIFGKFGKITRCLIIRGMPSRALNYGFIEYESMCAAEQAHHKANGRKLYGIPLHIEFSKSLPGERRKRLIASVRKRNVSINEQRNQEKLHFVNPSKRRSTFQPHPHLRKRKVIRLRT